MKWDELVERHKQLLLKRASAKELASLENELVVFVVKTSTIPTAKWQQTVFGKISAATGCSADTLRKRRDLFLAGWAADPLWDQLQTGMPLGTAAAIFRAARQRVKKNNPTGLRREIVTTLRAMGVKVEEETEEVPEIPTETHDFWSRLRGALVDYAKSRLADVPEEERGLLVAKFATDLRIMMDAHQQTWYAAAHDGRNIKKVLRQKFLDALRVLHLDPPKRLEPLKDVLERAKKQQRTLARQYHPDRHGGSEHTRSQYEAVILAYTIIQKYVEENTTAQPALRLVDGGKK